MEKAVTGKVFKGSLSQENAMNVKPIVECTREEGLEQIDRLLERLRSRRAELKRMSKEHKPHCGPEFGLACTCNYDPSTETAEEAILIE